MNTRDIHSTRFFPHWSDLESIQVVGLINMINNILEQKNTINNLVEIGSHLGESASIFLGFQKIKSLYCVDIWSNSIFEHIFDARLNSFINDGRCKKIKMLSSLASHTFADNSLDMVYIDGNHDYEYVKEDIKLWYPKLTKNGILSGHDYAESHPGTQRAINEFIDTHKLKLNTFIDASWYTILE